MKKILVAAAAAATVLFSCGKEDPAKGIVVSEAFEDSATIKGVAYAGIVDGEFVPAGTELIFTVDNSEYGNSGTLAEGKYVTTATVGEDGTYLVAIPARADGKDVSVKINASSVILTVNKEGRTENIVFTLAEQTQAVCKGLTYTKKLNFAMGAPITTTDKWVEGTYNVTLKYNNGKELVAVPAGTKVQVTIPGSSFVPAKPNAEVFDAVVGGNGLLTIKIPAKSLTEEGTPVNLKSSFVADKFTIKNGTETKVKTIFSLDEEGTVYGGEINNASPLEYGEGEAVEQLNPLSTWKNAKYTVSLRYQINPSDTPSPLPDDAKITITTTNRNYLTQGAGEIIVICKVSDLTNGFTFLAPDPVLSSTALKFKVEVNFIVEADKKQYYKFDVQITEDDIEIWGGIDKKGGNGSDNTLTIPEGKPL